MKKSLYLIIILALLLVDVLNGCSVNVNPIHNTNPSATPSATPSPQTLSINSTAGLDGLVSCNSDPYFLEAGTISSLSVTFNDPTIKIGSRHPVASDKVLIARGLLSFDLSSLAGKTITNAVLKVHIYSVTPNDPFNTGLGGLLVDHFTTNYTTGTTMDILFIGMLPNVSGGMSADQGWRVINVTNEVVADQTAGCNSQYRLHFENELTVSSSQKEIDIESGENANNKPVLIVTYQ